MKITFLGTSADTSFPLSFCRCYVCQQARKLGGKNLRNRSSLLVNDDLLIDMGPDIVSSAFSHKIDLSKIKYWLQTHPHHDHFDPNHLITRIPEYAGINLLHIDLFASHKTLQRMSTMIRDIGYIQDLFSPEDQVKLNLSVHTLKHFQSAQCGQYQVLAIPANHDDNVDALLYAITNSQHSVFYGTDTDVISEDTLSQLEQKGMTFDLVILDQTYGSGINGGGHLNDVKLIQQIESMKTKKLLKKNCQIFATHLSHEGNLLHHKLDKIAIDHGYRIAYDGLVINL